MQRKFHGIKIEYPPELKDNTDSQFVAHQSESDPRIARSVPESETTNRGVVTVHPPSDYTDPTTNSAELSNRTSQLLRRSFSDSEATYSRRQYHGVPIASPTPEKEQEEAASDTDPKSSRMLTKDGKLIRRYSREFLLSCYDSARNMEIPVTLHFTFMNSDAGYIVEVS